MNVNILQTCSNETLTQILGEMHVVIKICRAIQLGMSDFFSSRVRKVIELKIKKSIKDYFNLHESLSFKKHFLFTYMNGYVYSFCSLILLTICVCFAHSGLIWCLRQSFCAHMLVSIRNKFTVYSPLQNLYDAIDFCCFTH